MGNAGKALAAPWEREWISVEERLPSAGERVLTTDGAFVGEMYINKRGKWQRYNVNDSSLLMALDILWWMPMPEPPNEEKENNADGGVVCVDCYETDLLKCAACWRRLRQGQGETFPERDREV